MLHKLVAIKDHPINADRTAALVAHVPGEWSIYRTASGFVACRYPQCIDHAFPTLNTAVAAIEEVTA